MAQNKKGMTRRGFIAGASLTGLSSMLALSTGLSGQAFAQDQQTSAPAGAAPAGSGGAKIPTRPFGKDKLPVAILSMGGMYPIQNNQIMLKKALDWGMTYWDTAHGYENGNSELGIGMYFDKFPESRKQVFLATKSPGRNPDKLTEHLNLSLERLKTDYIDLYFIHAVSSPGELNDELKEWGRKMKAAKKIRMFGFSTHSNMEALLAAAPKLGWVDAIMMTYNYRNMQSDAMKRAVEACYKAGIGLTAMKTQARSSRRGGAGGEEDFQLAEPFVAKGYTPEQAKMKIVWQNEMISSICSQMPNLTIMSANVAAAMDKTKLSAGDFQALRQHAQATCSGYCAGCTQICDAAIEGETRIGEVMRLMMYHNGYGDTHRARQLFAALPAAVRENLLRLDFSPAERLCPQGIAIGELMKEAAEVLA